MTENKRFILTEQFVTLQGITFVKDDNAYVDTYYTVGGAVDLLNDYAYDNEQLIKENCEYKRDASKDQDLLAEFHTEIEQLKKENEQLKKELSDIDGQLLMLDNCDNWDYDRMKHTVREIAEIIGYNGTINPKRG